MVKALNPPIRRKSKLPKIVVGGMARRVSIRIPAKMLEELNDLLAREGKTGHYKGKWISDAILALFQEEDYIELINEEWLDRKNNVPLQVTLTKEAEDVLAKIQEALKKESPGRKDLISATIRVAMTAALIRCGVI